MTAVGTSFTTGVEPVHKHQPTSIKLAFVLQLTAKLSKAHISNSLSQLPNFVIRVSFVVIQNLLS